VYNIRTTDQRAFLIKKHMTLVQKDMILEAEEIGKKVVIQEFIEIFKSLML